MQQENEAVGTGGGGGGGWELAAMGICGGAKMKHSGQRKSTKKLGVKGRIGSSSQMGRGDDNYENESDDDPDNGGGGVERQREHPFIVTEPGEVARGKKNGLDYLFHLYEQCRDFLIQVQTIAKERGEKCPTKVLLLLLLSIYVLLKSIMSFDIPGFYYGHSEIENIIVVISS